MTRASDPVANSDRRDSPRVAIDKRFSIRLDPGDGRPPVDCGLLDYSVTGMRLELPEQLLLPDEVRILIGEIAHNARIVWRKDTMIGVDFVDEHYSIY